MAVRKGTLEGLEVGKGAYMNIAVCDGDIKIIGELENIVDSCFLENRTEYHCDTFLSGDELLGEIEGKVKPYQIYILDIEMKGRTGLEVAKEIRQNDRDALIIFSSNHSEVTQEVFDVMTFHFLVKPLDLIKFKQVLLRAIYLLEGRERFFQFKSGKRRITLDYSSILYFENQKRKMIVYTNQEFYEFYSTTKELLSELNKRLFAQIHNSYIVCMDAVVTLEKEEVVLKSGVSIPISKTYCQSFNTAYKDFILMRMKK